MDKQRIGQRIKQARKLLGLSQEELARRVGIEQSRISKLENGNVSVPLEAMAAIARTLGRTIDELTAPRIAEPEGDYRAATPATNKVLADYNVAKGLHDLAADAALAEVMKITAPEWEMLASIKLPRSVSKTGYLQLLITLRAICPASSLEQAQPRPGVAP